jgi:regulator of sigma E protease
MSEAEKRDSFFYKKVYQRAAIVAAGPIANFILAIVIFAVLALTLGKQVTVPRIDAVTPGTAAASAGFKAGDVVVSVEGKPAEGFSDVQRAIALNPGRSLAFVVDRGGERVTLSATPQLREERDRFNNVQRLVSGRAGDAITFVMLRDGKDVTVTATPEPMEQEDALGNKVKVAVIGVVNNQEVGQPRLVTYSPAGAVMAAVEETGHIIERTGQFLTRFAVGREDKCQLGGPVKIAGMAGQAAQLGFVWLVQLVALLSVGIGILNLLPIPPLDGGHLAFYGVEAVMRRPVSERMMEAGYRIGLLLVLGFMGFVFWNDLFGC